VDIKYLDARKYCLKDQSRELIPFYSQPAGAAKRTAVEQQTTCDTFSKAH